MDGFKFKGTLLSTIIDTGSTSAPGYTVKSTSIKYATTTFANSKPLPTGYQVKGVDLSNTARADNKAYYNTSTGKVPVGAKSCRYILRGGGGGTGGGGGAAQNPDGVTSYSYGQHGLAGTGGALSANKFTVQPDTSFTVTIGKGGGAGTGGAVNRKNNPNAWTTAKTGEPGGDGGATYITFDEVTPAAKGGPGGAGGAGGSTHGDSGSTSGGGRATKSTAPTPSRTDESLTAWEGTYVDFKGGSSNLNYDSSLTSAGGNLSNGSLPGWSGKGGTNGSAHIIWLYE